MTSAPSNTAGLVFPAHGSIPQGAKLIQDESTLIQIKMTQIRNWEPASDFWALRNGQLFNSFTSVMSSMYITANIRSFFQIMQGKHLMTSMLTSGFVSGISCSMFTQSFVLNPILTRFPRSISPEHNPCDVCLQTRIMTLNAITGIVIPVNFGFITSCLSCLYTRSMEIPKLSDTKRLFNLYSRMIGSIKTPLAMSLALNSIVGVLITNFVINEHDKLSEYNLKLKE